MIQFSAAGFRDFTRIAASDPTMWRDVFLNNREACSTSSGASPRSCSSSSARSGPATATFLHAYFTRTRAIRRGIIEAGQDTPAPAPDFGRAAAKGAAE